MAGEIKRAMIEARERGEKQFFANVPCRPYGHNANRFTASGQCVECDRIRYAERSEKRIPQMRAWRKANPEVQKEACRNWQKNNPDRVRTYAYRRRRRADGAGYTHDQVKEILAAQGGKCANCFKRVSDFHADHVVPLSLGGEHDIRNIQVLCPGCNLRKHKKDPIQWANENGRLL